MGLTKQAASGVQVQSRNGTCMAKEVWNHSLSETMGEMMGNSEVSMGKMREEERSLVEKMAELSGESSSRNPLPHLLIA